MAPQLLLWKEFDSPDLYILTVRPCFRLPFHLEILKGISPFFTHPPMSGVFTAAGKGHSHPLGSASCPVLTFPMPHQGLLCPFPSGPPTVMWSWCYSEQTVFLAWSACQCLPGLSCWWLEWDTHTHHAKVSLQANLGKGVGPAFSCSQTWGWDSQTNFQGIAKSLGQPFWKVYFG